jgi:lipoprotein-anchoring transpeptidase ErfK/SrfK
VITSGEVSSGSKAHPTPSGSFRVQSKQKNKRSGKYTNYFDQNTPMPYSLQFHGPYFIHEGWLPGYADSHGCVRLHYEDARFLFDRMRVGDRVLVKRKGRARPEGLWADVFPVF